MENENYKIWHWLVLNGIFLIINFVFLQFAQIELCLKLLTFIK